MISSQSKFVVGLLSFFVVVAPLVGGAESSDEAGYIVRFSEPSLAEAGSGLTRQIYEQASFLELSEDASDSAKIQSKIVELRGERARVVRARNDNLSAEHQTMIKDMKARAPSLRVNREFYTAFNGLYIDATPTDIKKLKKAGYILSPNGQVTAQLSESVPLIGAPQVWALSATSTGVGIKIGILDTGIDYTHPDLGGCFGAGCKVAGGYDIRNNDADPMDDNGHGTHVASIAAGNGVLKGAAPGATLYAFKVLGSSGGGSFAQVIEGINRALDPNQDSNFEDGMDVINLSFGGLGTPDDSISQTVNNAVSAGVAVVVSAGNDGPKARTITTPGLAKDAITVGASDKTDVMSEFSSRGPVVFDRINFNKPDVVAPGVSICAARFGASFPSSTCLDSSHIVLSGTSMAAPHVAGAAALILQAHPLWSPAHIKTVLKRTAKNLGVKSQIQGAGRVDAFVAVSSPTPVLCPTTLLTANLSNRMGENTDAVTAGQVSALQAFLWQYKNVFYKWRLPKVSYRLIDGTYGGYTASVIRSFQKEFNVTLADGESGRVFAATRAAIMTQCDVE